MTAHVVYGKSQLPHDSFRALSKRLTAVGFSFVEGRSTITMIFPEEHNETNN